MKSFMKLVIFGAAAVGLTFGLAGGSVAQTAFDMGPTQAGRVHTTAGEAAKVIPKGVLVKPGKLTVAMSPYLPPTGFFATDEKTVIGANADLAYAVAEKLGLELDIQVVAFPDWPLGIESGKYDAFISDITVTEKRKEKFDFATYANDVIGFYVAKDSGLKDLTDPKSVQGLKVVVGSGTNHEKIMLEWNRQNESEGLKPAELVYYDDPTAARLALIAGRVDAMLVNNSEGAYAAATDGKTKLAGIVSGGWPRTAELGIVTKKGNGLVEAVAAALNELIAEGTYRKVLERWSVEAQALKTSKVNPPGLEGF